MAYAITDPDGVHTYEAPIGFTAVLRKNGSCDSALNQSVKCSLFGTSACDINLCRGGNRLDRKHVIFLPSMLSAASIGNLPLLSSQNTLKKIPDFLIHKGNDGVSNVAADDAPAGMKAVAATNGCQGCFYLRGKADCVRSSSVSCTELGRKDAQNVIFQPRV